jgi:hypothetical protein
MTLECEHGQLARACTVCYLERELAGHEAVMRQALEALETPIHEQPLGMRQEAITALRERLGTQFPADIADRLARHGIPMPGEKTC